MTKITTPDLTFLKLTWACRRGMLELDVLLGHFLKTFYFLWNDDEKSDFLKLLDYPDPSLYAYLMGYETIPDLALSSLVHRIRSHARFSS